MSPIQAMGGTSSVQLAMLGLDSAGKTTLLYRLKFDQYTETSQTIGFNCEKIMGITDKTKGILFKIWDAGGQDKIRPLWRSYTRSSDGIIFVVDSDDKERLEEAKIELIKLVRSPDNPGLPILIVANKQDLPNALEAREVEKHLGLSELPAGQVWSTQATCAVTGEGLMEAMDLMCELIEKRKKTKKKR